MPVSFCYIVLVITVCSNIYSQ